MKKIYTVLILLISFYGYGQIETNITNLLGIECNVSECQDYTVGACIGDLDSEGNPREFTDFQVYYVTETIIIEYNSLTLRNCRIEFRNGANFVDNGIVVDEQTDCDVENTTEIVFLGGGNRFATEAEMNATLSLSEVEFYRKANISYYDMLGKTHRIISTLPRGIYIKEYSLDGRVERKKEVKK